jgi:hypothetical protein
MKQHNEGPASADTAAGAKSGTPAGTPAVAPDVAPRGDASLAASAEATRRRSSHNLDVVNAATMDSSVDTDGKSSDARRDLPLNRDNVVGSNASLDDSIEAPAEGLAGIDSRGGNLPLIDPGSDHQVEYLGTVTESDEWRDGEDALAARADNPHGEADANDFDHHPVGRERVTQVVRISPKKS